jgi:TRAP transporter TAXI family solute receptor
MLTRSIAIAALAAFSALSPPALAQDVKLPAQMVWMGFDTGSASFNMAVAMGQAFKNAYGSDLRLIAGSNDIARLAPVRGGRAVLAQTGIGAYFAQEGIDEFGVKEWGPQKLRRVASAHPSVHVTIVAANDVGIKTMADLKGKRVAWVVGSPGVNRAVTAQLAFAGLTWADVKKVEFASFNATLNGILNGEVDAAYTNTTTGKLQEIDRSPRGIIFPALPHADEAGWTRQNKIAPFFIKSHATLGVGLSKDKPHEGGAYPQPNLVTYPEQNADVIYNIVKAMIVQFDKYKDSVIGAEGFAVNLLPKQWVIPFHEGAIRAFREHKVWDDAAQKHNDELIKRQDVLAAAWGKMSDKKNLGDAEFRAEWQKVRADGLRAAGLDPIWDSWD